MELIDVVMKINGPILPIGDSHVDGSRLENLTALCALTNELLDRIEIVAQCYGGHMASVKAAKDRAAAFLIDASARAAAPAEPPAVEAGQVRDEGFSAGTIAALACVTAQDSGVLWAEIVRAAGTQDILKHAMTNEGDWEWGGFSKYAEAELGKAQVEEARESLRAQSAAVEAAPMVKE